MRKKVIRGPGNTRGRVGEIEYQILKNLARYERVSISEMLRLSIREAAKSRNLWPPAPAGEVQRCSSN
ncbi:MAG: hypothetical protein JW953_17315 [Anaerolineae bacterium]|nr:hypothetical protein [Anaerolineae bacterium]